MWWWIILWIIMRMIMSLMANHIWTWVHRRGAQSRKDEDWRQKDNSGLSGQKTQLNSGWIRSKKPEKRIWKDLCTVTDRTVSAVQENCCSLSVTHCVCFEVRSVWFYFIFLLYMTAVFGRCSSICHSLICKHTAASPFTIQWSCAEIKSENDTFIIIIHLNRVSRFFHL